MSDETELKDLLNSAEVLRHMIEERFSANSYRDVEPVLARADELLQGLREYKAFTAIRHSEASPPAPHAPDIGPGSQHGINGDGLVQFPWELSSRRDDTPVITETPEQLLIDDTAGEGDAADEGEEDYPGAFTEDEYMRPNNTDDEHGAIGYDDASDAPDEVSQASAAIAMSQDELDGAQQSEVEPVPPPKDEADMEERPFKRESYSSVEQFIGEGIARETAEKHQEQAKRSYVWPFGKKLEEVG